MGWSGGWVDGVRFSSLGGSIGRSIARSLGRSICRSLSRSVDRSLPDCVWSVGFASGVVVQIGKRF